LSKVSSTRNEALNDVDWEVKSENSKITFMEKQFHLRYPEGGTYSWDCSKECSCNDYLMTYCHKCYFFYYYHPKSCCSFDYLDFSFTEYDFILVLIIPRGLHYLIDSYCCFRTNQSNLICWLSFYQSSQQD